MIVAGGVGLASDFGSFGYVVFIGMEFFLRAIGLSDNSRSC